METIPQDIQLTDFTHNERVLLQKLLETLVDNQRQMIATLTSITSQTTSQTTSHMASKTPSHMSPALVTPATDCRCIARIHDNTQCTRKQKDTVTQLCGSHVNSLPYSKIGDLMDNTHMVEKKCREHKKKICPSSGNGSSQKHVDLTKYIETELININNVNYLIDKNGILFENNEMCMIMGHKLADNKYEWF